MSNQEFHQEPNQEPAATPKQESATPKVTSIEKKTQLKNPGRVAAGKKLKQKKE